MSIVLLPGFQRAGISRLLNWENNELTLIYPVAALGVLLGLGSPKSEIRCPSYKLLPFSLECITNEKLRLFFMQRITEIFSLWQVW
jgi:hypothetical protein